MHVQHCNVNMDKRGSSSGLRLSSMAYECTLVNFESHYVHLPISTIAPICFDFLHISLQSGSAAADFSWEVPVVLDRNVDLFTFTIWVKRCISA